MAKIKYDHILWDWNGTLLDDIDACIISINKSLTEYSLPLMTRQKYFEKFDFPVKNYYARIGFDISGGKYETLAQDYIENYVAESKVSAKLHDGVVEMLQFFYENKVPQSILSASEYDILIERLGHYGILKYFAGIKALDNIYAHGKLHLGREWVAQNPGKKVLFIGDTKHDFEVAADMGADCILFSGGHCKKQQLELIDCIVIDDLREIKEYVYGD
ncbi:MAG: HAD hydrolase-like protein [Clostridia bacterium]|nr:HAD hydrolase-like protein [Clostridia bacterium]